jgi:hypothetical protein
LKELAKTHGRRLGQGNVWQENREPGNHFMRKTGIEEFIEWFGKSETVSFLFDPWSSSVF